MRGKATQKYGIIRRINMFDNVTLKLNADPLIISALKEDITSEDVSTNSVMPEPKKGEVQLICKQDGIICGLPIFAKGNSRLLMRIQLLI